jgi:hypothetical protein
VPYDADFPAACDLEAAWNDGMIRAEALIELRAKAPEARVLRAGHRVE